MIYDNPKCVSEAERIVEQFAGNRVKLKEQIAGELNRYFTLGKSAALRHMETALDKCKKVTP